MLTGVVGFALNVFTDTGIPYVSGMGVSFWDTIANPASPAEQCGVGFTTGSGQIYINDYNGNIVASTENGVFPESTWIYVEIMVTVGSPTTTPQGSVSVRINNQPVPGLTNVVGNFHYPGIGSGSTYPPAAFSFNRIEFSNSSDSHMYVDDFHVNSTATSDPGSYPNNSWMGDTRALTLYPSTDFSVSWTNPHMTYYDYPVPPYPGGTYGSDYNHSTLVYTLVNTEHTGNLVSITINLVAAVVGHVNGAIYSDVGGNPGNLLATGTPVTNPTAGIMTIPISGITIQRGTPYWVAIQCDADLNGQGYGSTSYSRQAIFYGWTYTGTFPAVSNAGAAGTALGGPGIGMVSTMNAQNVNELYFDGDMSYNTSITPGQEDLFNCDSTIPSTLNIIGIQVIGAYKKDDANAHTMTQHLRSGTADAAGTVFTVSSSWFYTSDIWILDPATGANWTVGAANTIQIGYKLET
jgi:hypothetical protein